MNIYDEKRDCTEHGRTLFKHRKNKKGQWWICYICLKNQWKKAQAKRRKKYDVREYQRKFNKEKSEIIKSLSLTLKFLLIASFLKPE
jgi:hypothetical protein